MTQLTAQEPHTTISVIPVSTGIIEFIIDNQINNNNIINDLRDLSSKSNYILFLGVTIMVISMFFPELPWMLSVIPITGSFFLNIVSKSGEYELKFYRENQLLHNNKYSLEIVLWANLYDKDKPFIRSTPYDYRSDIWTSSEHCVGDIEDIEYMPDKNHLPVETS